MSASTRQSLHPGLNLGAEHGDDHLEAETSGVGFLVFMMSDMVTFGMFFAVFATTLPLACCPGPTELFDLGSIAWQTSFLLLSSMTSGMAVLTMKQEHGGRSACIKKLVFWLLLTVLLGCGFLYREISDFIFMATAGGPPTRSGYLSALWSLVGLHGLHVTGGILWCLVIVVGVMVRGVDLRWKLALLRWAVFWHFLDVVWIFIFSFVFLGGLL